MTNSPDDRTQFTLRLPADLHRRLQESAGNVKSVNAEIIERLEETFRSGYGSASVVEMVANSLEEVLKRHLSEVVIDEEEREAVREYRAQRRAERQLERERVEAAEQLRIEAEVERRLREERERLAHLQVEAIENDTAALRSRLHRERAARETEVGAALTGKHKTGG